MSVMIRCAVTLTLLKLCCSRTNLFDLVDETMHFLFDYEMRLSVCVEFRGIGLY